MKPIDLKTKLRFGAAYYPEHVTPERVAEDARLMKEAGMTLVRMGELSWIRTEREEGVYDFSWLDHAVETLAAHGVKSLLCTPTATPPKWVMDKYPDVYQFHADGRRREFGGRRHYCVNSPSYRRLSVRIAEAIGSHYAGNPHVIGYQIDNELMAEDPYCHCPTCVEAFRGWLRKKFGAIEELNRRWGLDFWSQCYRSFDEVVLPRINAHQSPSSTLDLQRFFSECFVNYAALQGEALRRTSPGKTVTHNVCSCGFLYRLDLNRLGKELDIVSVDNYPVSFTFESEYGNSGDVSYHPSFASLALSMIRGAKKAPFWVTEAQSGRTMRPRKLVEPGFLGALTRQELAHGARTVLYFSWRAFPSGVEFMLAGVIPSDSKPRRTYREIGGIIRDSRAVEERLTTLMPIADVAILRDFECDWALDDGLPHPDFRYLRHLHLYSRALFENHVNVDILSPEDEFGNHRILILPAQILMDEALASKLTRFVEDGGHLLLTCLTAIRDRDNRNRPETLPALLSSLCGIEIEEQQPLKFRDTVRFRSSKGTAHEGCWWFDLLAPSAEADVAILAAYDDRWFSGTPAITRRYHGKGSATYLGTVPDVPYLRRFLADLCTEAGIPPSVTEPSSPMIESLKVFHSTSRDGEHLHLVNFTNEPQEVTLPSPHRSLPGGGIMEGRITLAPFGSLLLEKIP